MFLRHYALVAASASVIAVFASGDSCLAAAELDEGKHEIRAEVHGDRATVVVQIVDGRDCIDSASLKWGVERACPRHRVASLSVTYRNEDGWVAASAYSDITALRTVHLGPTAGGFAVTLRGGDAATGYTAVLRFSTENKKRRPVLISRKAWSGENPENRIDLFEYRTEPVDADY